MNGMFKLSLDEPAGAFGHQEYPQLLTRVLTQNAQKKSWFDDGATESTYTPQISRIVFNYKAYSTINFDQSQSELASQHQEVFLHLHPMGSKVMRVNESKMIPLVPHYPAAGNLMIGLDAERLQRPTQPVFLSARRFPAYASRHAYRFAVVVFVVESLASFSTGTHPRRFNPWFHDLGHRAIATARRYE